MRDWLWQIFPANNDSDKSRQLQRRLRLAAGALVLLLTCAALLLLYLRSDGARSRKALRAAQQAWIAYDAGDFLKAQDLGREAWSNGSTHPEVILSLARLATANGSEDAIQLWKQYGELTQSDPAEASYAVEYGHALLRCGRTNEATIIAAKQKSLSKENNNPELISLFLQLNHRKGQSVTAMQHLQKLHQLRDLTAFEKKIGKDLILSGSRFPGHEALQRDYIASISKDSSSLDLSRDPFLETVLSSPPLSTQLRLKLIRAVVENTTAPEFLKIQALGLEVSTYPHRKYDIILREADRRKDLTATEITPFCHWLNSLGEYEETLALLSLYPKNEIAAAIRPKCDALLASTKLKELHELIYSQDSTLLPAQRSLYKGHLSRLENDETSFHNHLKEALRYSITNNNPSMVVHLSDYCLEAGKLALAKEGYEQLLRIGAQQKEAYRGLLAIAEYQGSTDQMCSALQGLYREGHDSAHLRELLYLNLLSGRMLETATQQTRRYAQTFSSDTNWQLNLHLLEHRLNTAPSHPNETPVATPKELDKGKQLVWKKVLGQLQLEEIQIYREQLLPAELEFLQSNL